MFGQIESILKKGMDFFVYLSKELGIKSIRILGDGRPAIASNHPWYSER
jgi:hypothetical protein